MALLVAMAQLVGFAAIAGAPCAGSTQGRDDHECCPVGMHPPGMCPMHRAALAHAQRAPGSCALQCGTETSPRLLASIGMVPPEPAELPVPQPGHTTLVEAPVVPPRAPHLPLTPPPRRAA
jgi:hypothetical protein